MSTGVPIVRRLTAVLVAAVLLAACQSEPTPAPSTSATSADVQLTRREGQNGAATPSDSGSAYVAAIPRGVKAMPYYRSEGFWTLDGQLVELHEGDRISLDMTITPQLGGVGSLKNQWSVVWQLHGPMDDGSWRAPVLALTVDKGSWRLTGGSGHPDGNRSGWADTRPTYLDGQPAHWRMDLTVSTDPRKASVNATINDQQVATDWHPPAGTLYPGQQWVGLKSGLYTGGQDGASADPRARSVTVDIGSLTVTRP